MNANNCELCNNSLAIVGYNGVSGAVIRFPANPGIRTNIELNTYHSWNQVPRLASLKKSLLHIGGASSGGVRSQFLH
jgi:hypothetical protein